MEKTMKIEKVRVVVKNTESATLLFHVISFPNKEMNNERHIFHEKSVAYMMPRRPRPSITNKMPNTSSEISKMNRRLKLIFRRRIS